MRRPPAIFAVVLTCSVGVAAQRQAHEQQARDIYEQLVEINTTDTPAGNTTLAAEAMAARFRAAGFPESDIRVLGPTPTKQNLVVRYRGTGTTPPVLLLAHLDVVDARREDWSFDPWVFREEDGWFYGRGTADDKAMASQFVANLLRLKAEAFTPDRDLILALTADEEGGNFNGVQWILDNQPELIRAEFAINEGGGGEIRDGRYVTNTIQASEKVYQDFRLEVTNAGGHSSLPVRDNAIYRLAAGLARLAAFDFPIELNEVTRTFFERSAAAESDPRVAADMRAVSRNRPDAAAASRLAARLPYWNALMRTTCVATRLEGGHANNALPQLAAATVNCRLLPGTSAQSVKAKLSDVLADSTIAVSFIDDAKMSPPTALRPDLMRAVETLVHDMFPGVIVVPVMSTGATDGLRLRNAGIPTFGVDGTFTDVNDVRAHGRDERVGVKQYFEGLEFHYRLMKVLAKEMRAAQ
jgi:acetylornithine deacetylase/succinyl-diaminopimelate desuccinylase-like protein